MAFRHWLKLDNSAVKAKPLGQWPVQSCTLCRNQDDVGPGRLDSIQVTEYFTVDRRALDDDYRLSVLWQIAIPVWKAANNIPSGIWWHHLERIFLAIDDLGCRDFLTA